MDNVFDPDTFMQTSIDEANDTQYATIPAGEYVGIIEKIDIPKGRTTKDGKPIYPLDVTWNILDDEVKMQLDRDKLVVRQSVFLDITDAGSLDMGKGKNVGLGKLREALGMNGAGFSLAKLNGAGPAKVVVTQEPDKRDMSVIRNRVASVGKLD